MALLKLDPDPTFLMAVEIPIPGKGKSPVKFEFKHRTKDELAAFLKSAPERTDVESVLQSVVSWELVDAFNKENVERLLLNYHGAAHAIADVYFRELMGLRTGN